MHKLDVVNIKCGGCSKRIAEKLQSLGFTNVKVSPEEQTISFEGEDVELAKRTLTKMGYPEAGSKSAKAVGKKAKSYVSCAIGRWG